MALERIAQRKRPHVAVCVDNGRAHGRGVLKGIADYVDTYGPWSLFLDPQADSDRAGGRSKNWKGDGILTYVDEPARAKRLRKSGIPTVELFAFRDDALLPLVASDDVAIGRIAAEHLVDRHFQFFAFTGYRGVVWSERRKRGFLHALRQAGMAAPCCLDIARPRTLPEWERVQEQLTHWAKDLPKPIGLMACSDHHAQRVLDACQRAGICVPDEISVIGVDNNEEVCRLSNPPLTSVMDDPRTVGFEGARLLDQLMSGEVLARRVQPKWIPPLGVVTRRSTDVTAIEDRLMAEVIRFMREYACTGLNMKELPARFGLSRTVFYRRFQDALQRSPHEEILRIQMERAKALLTQTSLPLEKIAELSGFQTAAYLSVVFKRQLARTPSDFRQSVSVGR
jgi:LacI family transcriptional regulator